MSNCLCLIVKLIHCLLGCCKDHKDCPDGVCDEPLAMADELTATLNSPNVSVGIFDLWRLMRCVPMDRVTAVVKRIGKLFAECDSCPEEGCSFLDLIGCVDLKELVSIAKEVLSIIRDSTFCDGFEGDDDQSGPITLGQASAAV